MKDQRRPWKHIHSLLNRNVRTRGKQKVFRMSWYIFAIHSDFQDQASLYCCGLVTRLENTTAKKSATKVRMLACVEITSAMKTTASTAALDALLVLTNLCWIGGKRGWLGNLDNGRLPTSQAVLKIWSQDLALKCKLSYNQEWQTHFHLHFWIENYQNLPEADTRNVNSKSRLIWFTEWSPTQEGHDQKALPFGEQNCSKSLNDSENPSRLAMECWEKLKGLTTIKEIGLAASSPVKFLGTRRLKAG